MKEKVAEGLKTEHQNSNFQPKIHKKGNSGCPVVSSVNYHSSNISKYTD